jgi:hypothetical protein
MLGPPARELAERLEAARSEPAEGLNGARTE